MDEPIFSRIMAATTSKEAWDLLQEEYQGTSKVISVKLQTLRRDFENLIMKNSESIQVFFSRVSSIVNQIRTYGNKLDDKKIVEKVLRSLPNKFDHVVAVIEESKDLTKYSMNELMGFLQAHEQRLNMTTENSLEQAFQSKVDLKKNQMIQIKVSEEEEVVVDPAAQEEVEANSMVIKEIKVEVTMNLLLYFVLFVKDQIIVIRIVDIRIVEIKIEIYHNIFIAKNSGCSNHMTGNKEYFLETNVTVKPRVRMGDNNHVNAHGIGPIMVSTLCEKLAFWENTTVSNFQVSWRAYKPLMLIHADICGPMQTLSLSVNKYFILFVDDYSKMTWVYFLKQKDEAFSIFKQFKALVENQSGHSIITLRTDRGGEFISKEFQDFCHESRIKRQLTASYTPEQNGVAERKNRTFVEAARSMLKDKGLPNDYWAEAVATASPSSSDDSSPMSMRNLADIYDSCEFACFAMEPFSFVDAVKKKEWCEAMNEDIDAITKNNTWTLVDLPPNKESKHHLGAAKRIMRYIQGTINFGVVYSKVTNNKLICFFDSDWASFIDDRKSTTGIVLALDRVS
ncbi:uncharacterized protein LOC143861606 [Tasmannia lanceolata]|uniref:uncharacterized protein LOC143861606 n=1 Tax=Tasmannia lanceolata TaxID=3420 RepID=UPI004064A134